MDARSAALWLPVALLASACAMTQTAAPVRVALLAPFEGRYREVGYQALYAAQLAIEDYGAGTVTLLAVDDGGTAGSAVDRAGALVEDPLVRAVVVLGYQAAAGEAQRAFIDVPVIVAGHWDAQPQAGLVFMLASRRLDDIITVSGDFEGAVTTGPAAEAVGGEVFALEQFLRLYPAHLAVTVATSARLPDAIFAGRYRSRSPFAPPPGLLATLTYDAVGMATTAIVDGARDRAEVAARLSTMRYHGLNGDIVFEGGYWRGAPVNTYRYDENGALVPVDRVIE